MFKKNIIISIKLVMIFSFLINTLQYFIFAELTEITPISISTNDSTPEYGFNSDIETGNIIYGGSCGSGSLISISTTGTYTTIFNTLNDGEYNDCNLTISGITLNISPFTIDTTYPIITITNPDTTPALTKTITASTNEGTLKYAVNAIDDTTCNGTLTFRAYTAEIFTTEADNGKYICYKAIDEAENISYKLSDEIGGIDTTPPTATIQYTPAFNSRTNTDVITIITGFNETATGLNATGFTFTGNGTFPFTFEDLLGNTGEVIATVNRIDKSAPTWTINAGVNGGTVQTETINVTATDVDLDTGSLLYGFSVDDTCDITDTYTTSFTNSTDFIITGNNRQYLCLKGADNLGTISYTLVGQLETDNTNPSYSGIVDNAYYNTDVSIYYRDDFNIQGASVNTIFFASSTIFTGEGYHTLIVNDVAGNNTTGYFTIDKTQPVITNITTGQYINTSIIPAITEINYSGATLNGSDYTNGTAITNDGMYELIVTDLAGNSTGITFTIDKTDPTFAGVLSGIYYNTNQAITFDDTNLSGATLNGIAYTSGDTISAEGIYIFIVYDLAGNSTGATFTIDKTDPTFAGIISGIYYNTDQAITFDDTNLSGATLNGTTYISGNSISTDNSYIFIVYDLAGNSTGATFILDKTGPIIGTGIIVTGNTGVNGSTGYYNGTITIGTTISDALSNISGATCEYSTGISRAAATYSGGAGYCSISGLSPATNININFRVQDIAGNLSIGGTTTYIYDITTPTTTDDANSTTGRVDVTVTLTPIDGGVGLSGTLYCVDTTNTCTPNILGTSVSVTGATGIITHKYVRYYSVDKLNNTEATNTSVQINIDKEKPVLTGTTTFSSNNSTNTGYAKVNDIITVLFQSHETLTETPTMTISGGSLTTGTVTNIGGNNYSGSYVMKSTDTEGTIGFNIFMTDLVENTGTIFTGSTIVFDKTAPNNITFTSPTTNQRIAGSISSPTEISTHTITWNTGDDGGAKIDIQYASDGINYNITLTGNIQNIGSYLWTIPDVGAGIVGAKIKIKATDIAGNISYFTGYSFNIDSLKPSDIIVVSPNLQTKVKGGSIFAYINRRGGVDSHGNPTLVQISTNGGSSRTTANGSLIQNSTSTDNSTPATNGIFERNIPTAININNAIIRITVTDYANWSKVGDSTFFTIDSTAPSLSFSNASITTRRNTNTTATTTASDSLAGLSGVVQYRTDIQFSSNCNGGSPTAPIFSGDGIFTGYACIEDKAGNKTIATGTYKIDKTLPTLQTGSAITVNTATTINITGTDALAGISGYIRSKISGPGTISFTTNTSEDPTVSAGNDGDYILQILLIDNANNSTTGTINFTRDTVNPILNGATSVLNTTSQTPNYSFTGNEAGTISYSGSCSSATTAAISGLNTITFTALANATYSTCQLRVTDTAGNSSSRLDIPTFTINYTAPSGGGGGGGGGGSVGICTASQLICVSGIYAMKAGVNCQGGNLGNICGNDICIDGDYSGDPDDGICYDPTKIEAETENTTGTTITGTGSRVPFISPYNEELTNAYSYAYGVKITTVSNIKRANLTGVLIRSHLAKMMSQYATKVLGKTPDTTRNCIFKDMNGQTEEFKTFAILACQLGLMGLKTDGSPADIFNPNDEVSRAIFGTTLSRALFGDTNNGGQNRYAKHLEALKEKTVMNYIDKPFNLELRGYVMLMMMRADQQFIKSSYNTFTPLRGSKTFIPGKTITIISGSSQFTETELDFIENANKNYQFNAGYTIGESDLGIKYLQYLLKSKIYYTGAINGINTNNTVTALYEFQFDNNIVNKATDQGAGYLGPSTRELLNPLLQTLLNP